MIPALARPAAVCLCLGLLACGALAQTATVEAELSPRRVVLGEAAEYVLAVRIEAKSADELVAPEAPAFPTSEDYTATYLGMREGMYRSEQSIINGVVRTSASKTWQIVWSVVPKRVGLVRVPSFTFEHAGRSHELRPLSMDVSKDAPGNRYAELAVRVDDPTPLVNQPIELTFELSLQKRASSAKLEIPWQQVPNGFAGEPVEPEWTGGRGAIVEINGARFYALVEPNPGHPDGLRLIFRRTLYPLAPGRIELPPARAVVELVTRVGRDWRNQPTALETAKAVKVSPPLVIDVIEPPLAGRPPSFTGVVGNFTGDLRIGATEIRAGDGVTLTLELTGPGDLASIDPPELEGFDGFAVYPPDKKVEELPDAHHRLTIRWLVVPELDPAPSSFPEWSFSWFRPDENAYRTVSVGPAPLVVSGERRSAELIGDAGDAEGARRLRLLGEGVRAIADEPGDLDAPRPAELRGWFWLTLVLPLFTLAGCAFWRRRSDRLRGDASILRRRRASAAAAARLAEAAALIDSPRDFHGSLARSLTGFVGDKLGVPPARVAAATVRPLLEESGVRPELAQRWETFLEQLERLEYGRGDASPAERRQSVGGAEELVRELDREIGR